MLFADIIGDACHLCNRHCRGSILTIPMSSELLQVLNNSLNSDSNIRIAAELRLAELFTNSRRSQKISYIQLFMTRLVQETSIELINASLEQGLDPSIRQISPFLHTR